MRLLSTLILGGAVAFASPAVFADGHGHNGNGHHHGGNGGGHNHGGHNHGGHNHGGNGGGHNHGGHGHNHGGHNHHNHGNYWPGYNVYRPNYGYGQSAFPYYGAYGVGSPYYRGGSGFSLYIGK